MPIQGNDQKANVERLGKGWEHLNPEKTGREGLSCLLLVCVTLPNQLHGTEMADLTEAR